MSDIKQEETQQELFGEFSQTPHKVHERSAIAYGPKPFLFSITQEQIIFFLIVLTLSYCLVFFLGLLRGKTISQTASVVTEKAAVLPKPATQQLASRPNPPPQASPIATQSINKQQLVSKSAARPTQAPAIVVDQSKPYTIQLVTYKKEDLASRDVAALRSKGHFAMVIPSGDYYQVCVGQYANKDEAKRDLKTFKIKYKDCFLRRR